MKVPLRDWLFGLFGRKAQSAESGTRHRGVAIHIIILDGTMSSLLAGRETNAGLTFKLLQEASKDANLTVYYEAGIQWRDWSNTWDVMTGRGINRQIKRAYGVLASRYRSGDKVVLIGYSRGAYAVRSLAGVIDMVGLVRSQNATVRAVRQAYRHYRTGARSPAASAFRENYCHDDVMIDAVAVWDTVKALGLRLPIVWRWAQANHDFHNHHLGHNVLHGFHALAMDERREAYAPVMWTTDYSKPAHVEQVWFRGNHADVGGQVGDYPWARPLANIPLVWILEKLASCDVPLPTGWSDRFAQNVRAKSMGNWRGWSKIFLSRRRRIMGTDPSEAFHVSVTGGIAPVSSVIDLHNQASG